MECERPVGNESDIVRCVTRRYVAINSSFISATNLYHEKQKNMEAGPTRHDLAKFISLLHIKKEVLFVAPDNVLP